jgi:hypothetical protein
LKKNKEKIEIILKKKFQKIILFSQNFKVTENNGDRHNIPPL